MRTRIQALTTRLDVVLFTAALLTLAPLMAWWSILGRRQVDRIDQLERSVAMEMVPTGEQQHLKLDDITAHTRRQRLMVTGETALGGTVLAGYVAALFVLARNNRHANQAMRSMLQITAHELKTPIAGVKALLQSLQLGSIPEVQRQKLMERGVDECNRLEHLTETVLAYQRAVTRQSLKLEERLASSLVNALLEHRRHSFPDEVVSWKAGEEVMVHADADAFRVVLENLLDNARKYGGGQVELAARVEGQAWVLEARDQGIGFEPSHAEGLFTPWSRSKHHEVTKHGSGLGLYLSRQLAQAMGGTLTARSEGLGKGSTFVLSLRLA